MFVPYHPGQFHRCMDARDLLPFSLFSTTAQLAAMADIGNNVNVVLTVDPNGTISTTQGVYRLTVVYAQKI